MVAYRFGFLEVPLVGPASRGFPPEDLKQPDAIDRLMPQNSLDSFFARKQSVFL